MNGQAEIAGVPTDLLQAFSKRSVEIDEALADKIEEFVDREGRTPTRFEHAALEREAAKDTRHKKSGSVSPIWRHAGRPKPKPSAGPVRS